MYWKTVQLWWSDEKALKLDDKAVPKIVGEFLKPCSNQPQVSCPFSPVLGFFPLEGKNRLALWGQTDAEKCVLRSRQVKNFV
jgi:hypothetical protein